MQFQDHKFYNCIATLSNGAQVKLDANWLHNQGLDNWKSWTCNVGVTRIYIDPTGNIYSGECMNDLLGNINNEWDLLANPAICKQHRCTGCTDDLIIRKEKNVV